MEKREMERFASINLAEIDADNSGLDECAHMVCTLDMSSQGARLVVTSSRPMTFRIEGNIGLTFALEDTLVKLRGQTVHAVRKSDRQTLLGVKFCDLDDDQSRRISQFLELFVGEVLENR